MEATERVHLRVREKERERRERNAREGVRESARVRVRGEDNVNKRRRTMRSGSGQCSRPLFQLLCFFKLFQMECLHLPAHLTFHPRPPTTMLFPPVASVSSY